MRLVVLFFILTGIGFSQSTTPNLGMSWPAHGAKNWDNQVVANSVILDNIFGIPNCAFIGWDASAKQLVCGRINDDGAGNLTWTGTLALNPLVGLVRIDGATGEADFNSIGLGGTGNCGTSTGICYMVGSGAPEGVVTAHVGSLYVDITDGAYYSKTTGVAATGWSSISTGSSVASSIGLHNVLGYAPGIAINDGAAHIISTAAAGTVFNGITTLAGLAAISINGTTPFSWITSAPFGVGVYVVGATNRGSGGTAGTFSWSSSGGGCSVQPTGTFTVGAAGSIFAGKITDVSLTTRGSGCTSAPTLSTSASGGLSGAVLTPTVIANSTVGNLDIGWLAIQAALMTGRTYLPAGLHATKHYYIGTVMALPLYIPLSDQVAGFGGGLEFAIKGDGQEVTTIWAATDFGVGVPLLSCGDPAGTAANTLGRYAANSGQCVGDLEDIMLQSSQSNVNLSPGIWPINMNGLAWGARLRTKDIEIKGFQKDWSIVGDHTEFIRPMAIGGGYGFYWDVPNSTLRGDLTFLDVNASGQTYAAIGVSPSSSILGVTFNGETYLSAPYGILGDAGCGNAIIEDVTFDRLMPEFIGNAVIADDNAFNAATYTDANKCRDVNRLLISHSFYMNWDDTKFLAGSRGRRATFDVRDISMQIRGNGLAGNATFTPSAGPSGPSPIATFNVRNIGTGTSPGGLLNYITGDVATWISNSGSLPLVVASGGAGITLEQSAGVWKGLVAPWTGAGNYTSSVANDLVEYGSAWNPAGTSLTAPPIGVFMQGGIATTGWVPIATSGGVPVGVGQAAITDGTYQKGTGIGRALTITAAGSGGTNGSFSWVATGGGCTTEPTGTFTVAGGLITATAITTHGVGCTSGPSLSTAASSGLSGATLTPKWPGGLPTLGNSLPTGEIGYLVGGATGANGTNFKYSVLLQTGRTTGGNSTVGIGGRVVSTTPDPIVTGDRATWVNYTSASSTAVALPQAGTTGFAGNFVFGVKNSGTGLVTITPATSTIDGTATLVINQNSNCTIASLDNSNYTSRCAFGPIASGTSALGTGAISSGTCASAVTTTATGTLTTDVVTVSFNGDPTGVTGYIPATAGMLAIIAYPTANNVNFKVCNNTSSSVTPGAITLNWRVTR